MPLPVSLTPSFLLPLTYSLLSRTSPLCSCLPVFHCFLFWCFSQTLNLVNVLIKGICLKGERLWWLQPSCAESFILCVAQQYLCPCYCIVHGQETPLLLQYQNSYLIKVMLRCVGSTAVVTNLYLYELKRDKTWNHSGLDVQRIFVLLYGLLRSILSERFCILYKRNWRTVHNKLFILYSMSCTQQHTKCVSFQCKHAFKDCAKNETSALEMRLIVYFQGMVVFSAIPANPKLLCICMIAKEYFDNSTL